MIAVKKRYRPIPTGLASANAKTKKKQLMREGNAHTASNAYYAHDTVKTALYRQYHNKCCYCEQRITEPADRRMEHFRPKKAQTLSDQHPGYFWLTYEWHNLLLACNTCNIKKSNHFPVAGSRVTKPPASKPDWQPQSAIMRREQALLLNPETDDPTLHLEFTPEGKIHAIAGSEQGRATIRICNLDRESLTLEGRKRLVDGFREALEEQALILLDQVALYSTPEAFHAALELGFKSIVEGIKASMQPNQPFSRVGWHINQDPETFILAGIPDGEHKKIVRMACKRLGLMSG